MRRAKLRRQALIDFEIMRAPDRPNGEIAKAVGKDPWDVFFEVVRHGAFAMPESMSEANKIKLMQQEFVSFCTDVGPAGDSRIAAHPRAYGSFPRLLARYVGRQLAYRRAPELAHGVSFLTGTEL